MLMWINAGCDVGLGFAQVPSHAPDVGFGSWPCQNASPDRSESREVGDVRGMFRSDYALIAAISG